MNDCTPAAVVAAGCGLKCAGGVAESELGVGWGVSWGCGTGCELGSGPGVGRRICGGEWAGAAEALSVAAF